MNNTTRLLIGLLFVAGSLAAQPVIAPTNAPTESARGENIGGYNILNSWEVGYRFRDVSGNLGKYRSDVNFGNGVRLLGSQLSINSREGQGGYFDELLLSTIGLGNDPYQSTSFRVQKNKLYRYDLLWRENAYYNPALYIANGQHLIDTSHQLQDHNVTLFPQSSVKFLLGFSRNVQSGPALSTIQLFDSRGDEFPLFSDIYRRQNQVRSGAEINLFGARLFVMREWEFFSEDTREEGTPLSIGNNPTDPITLRDFQRRQPWTGSTRSWRVHLYKEQSDWLTWNARFTHADGERDFAFNESLTGSDRFNPSRIRQTLVTGNARRPVTTGNLTFTLLPGDRFSITNHSAFNNVRIDGDGLYSEINNTNFADTLINFELLSIQTIVNTTDAQFQATKWFGVHGGYQFSKRKVRSIQQVGFEDGFADRVDAEQRNTLHAGIGGVRIQPVKRLLINLDAEIGRADRPIYPISERNYHAFSARAQYRTSNLTLSAAARTNYNVNSVSLANHSSRGRSYWADANWSPRPWFGFNASYSKLHLDTATGIAYFAQGDLIENDRSIYISNIHLGHITARFAMGPRIELFAGMSHIQDTGDGRSVPTAGRDLLSPPGAREIFAAAQTFPLSFTSPLARISLRIRQNLRWNVGYQHYNYREDFGSIQDYRAHTGFTSLSWSF
jgi:hypothetical protein